MNYIQQAHDFLADGFNPLPLKLNKAPKLPTGHPFLDQPIDLIERRFLDCDMIGIACGPVSGGLYCFDFDGHDGEAIAEVYEDFIAIPFIANLIDQGKLTSVRTPSGGSHLYCKIDHREGGTVFARWESGRTMIESRGAGQYVATYPSPGYKYLEGVELCKLEQLESDEFRHIKQIARDFSLEPIQQQTERGDRAWPDRWNDLTVEGKFNNEGADTAKQLLIDSGWTYMTTRRHSGVELWQRPGKDPIKDGPSATWGKRFNMFYVFSSNAQPFKPDSAYSPFQVLTLLKFDGDWHRAKDSLLPPIEIREEEPEPPTDTHIFPLEVFPPFFRNYCRELNRTLNFHIDFSAVSMLFTIATVTGNKYKLKVKEGWEAPLIFWFACVGYPGTIKTHPVKTMIRPITRLDHESKTRWDEEMRHYDPDSKQPKPKFKQHIISDYTIEALHHVHDINRRGIGMYKDELKGFLNDMNKYRKGSDEEFWLESFNNGSYIVNRVTKDPIMVNNICINLIGTIQHDTLAKVVTDYAGNGLIDRFLFTASAQTVYNISKTEIDPEYAAAWDRLVTDLSNDHQYINGDDCEVLVLDDAGFEAYSKIDAKYVQMQNSDEYSQEIKNYLSKMKTYVPRFALLLAIMEAANFHDLIKVDARHMESAGVLADYFIKTAQDTFTFNHVQNEIREMVGTMRSNSRNEKIIKLYRKGIKSNEIARFFGLTRRQVSRILKESTN